MHRWVGLVLLGMGALAGCAGAPCEAKCEDDSDCEGGLICLTSTKGALCVPEDCDSCSKGCRYVIEDDGKGDRTCRYNRCL